jgi:hypothetical protein
MSETLTNIGGELIASKGADANLNYTLEYELAAGEVLTNSLWTESTGTLVLTNSGYTDTQTTVVVSSGVPGQWYILLNIATSSTGLVHEGSIRLYITDAPTLGAGLFLPFPNIPGAVASLRRDRLSTMLQTFLPAGATLDDSYLLEKLVAAASLISHKLRIPLVPTQVLPNTVDQSEIDSWTTPADPSQAMPVILEPAYDYDPSMFIGNTWGRTLTRQRPIITVQSMRFVYPTPTNLLYAIPNEWIRLDKKYGVINLVPIQTAAMLPLNAFILSALGGGRTVPNFTEIKYQAGIQNCAVEYPELLDLVKRQAVLGMAQDLFLPSSRNESTSADGLSQSTSIGFQIDSYEGMVDKQLASIKSSLFGIQIWSV